MANANSPRGLIPRRHVSGAPYNGAANRYYVPSSDGTAIFIGDPVKSTGSADANGVPGVIVAAAGNTVRGVCVGVEAITSSSTIYREASTERYILVADDPELLFEIQEDSVGNNLAVTEIGLNTDFVAGTGSTASGYSGFMLDSSGTGTGTANLRIVSLVQRVDNAIDTYGKYLVKINEHELASTTGV